jgi:hypothetical protein
MQIIANRLVHVDNSDIINGELTIPEGVIAIDSFVASDITEPVGKNLKKLISLNPY